MYAFVYTWTYLYIYISICTCGHQDIYVCIHGKMYINVFMYTCAFVTFTKVTYAHVERCIYMYSCADMYTCAYVRHVYMRICHICIHLSTLQTCIHAHTSPLRDLYTTHCRPRTNGPSSRHVCPCIHIGKYIYINTYTWGHKDKYIYVIHIYLSLHIYVFIYIYIFMSSCIFTYINI